MEKKETKPKLQQAWVEVVVKSNDKEIKLGASANVPAGWELIDVQNSLYQNLVLNLKELTNGL